MDSNKIDALLHKYWNCETSLEEEQQLREYFKSGNIPEQQKDTAALFRYFELQKKKSISDVSFDAQVLAKTNKTKRGVIINLVYNSMKIAAGVAVLLMAIWFIRKEVRKDTPQAMVDTYDDPKLALEETKKALLMISKGFGRAKEETEKINMFNEAKEEIKKKNTDTKESQL
jgi:hypothetical protein